MRILKYDDDKISAMTTEELDEYILDHSNYGNVNFRSQSDPSYGWAIPFVTDHKYKISWGFGLDFTRMRMTLSNRWRNNDKPVNLTFNFTDVRAAVNFTVGNV